MAPSLPKVSDTSGLDMAPFKAYEKAMRKRVDKGKIPGYCSAVVYKGELLHSDAYGCADPETGLKYGPDVLMRLYCMSKPFVAVGLLMLQDRGLLSVRDPVAKYIPSFRETRQVSRANSVLKTSAIKPKPFTILQCLTHTAGLGYGPDFNNKPSSAEDKAFFELVTRTEKSIIGSLGQFVDELAQLPLRFTPGKQWGYSYGVDVIGRVIEVVSGMTLGQFLKKEIFQKLGMNDTAFSFPKNKKHRFAAVYAGRETAITAGRKAKDLPRGKEALCRIDGMKPEESQWLEGSECTVESGGGFMGAYKGGLVSTVNDCARFMTMLSNGGVLNGVRILKDATIKRYCMPDLMPEVITNGKQQRQDGSPFGWTALGEVGVPRSKRDPPVDVKDIFEIGEVGGGGRACTYWSFTPSKDLAVLWFTQSLDNDPYLLEEENIYMASKKAVTSSTSSSDASKTPSKKIPVRKTIGKAPTTKNKQ